MSASIPPLVVIVGPTASGKSALALALAQQINGVIVNADSAQIYKDLRILSAAPTTDQLKIAEHRLYGVADGSSACSASDWAKMAKRHIAEVQLANRTPILVGGTGLYIRTLLDGIAPIPPIDPEVRASIRSAPLATNRARLEQLDPQAATRLRPADIARINRALEVVVSTGRTLGEWQHKREGGIAETVALRPLVLTPPRNWLYERCDERFAHMIDQGAVGEVEALLKRKLDRNLPVMRAIGVPELTSFLEDHLSLAEAILAGQQATRRYAKRQYTWFRHQPPAEWPRFSSAIEPWNIAEPLRLIAAGL
jgi:tRNA dimethylallyltransferase